MRILIVEDDFGSRVLMKKLLAGYGSCDVVVDGEEALSSFKMAWEEKAPYNLIMMDIMLPEMDGQEALQQIRAYEKEIGLSDVDRVKVIMTTALGDPKNVVTAYNKGEASSYIVKPVEIAQLKQEMSKLGFEEQ
ncbi:response regulator [Spirochaeta isovalerica]|uniref:Two-component system chemotaxis response regulator CheY n=1 Tax=Spirochaeta isovalerica TaxID=150 RepID=A0A841R7R1_9SPIO|nr:response regulator [Spirochaeta isovalerica]MBB6479009.1 two-component system chemotaxis response regulator CheY [Spirochaeta isovalerica]